MTANKEMSDIFRQEAEELLVEIEEAVLCLEENPEDNEVVNRLFRAVHTIKGSGGMFGFNELVDFTHYLETALDRLREGEIEVTRELTDLILKSKDYISSLLVSGKNAKVDRQTGSALIDSLNMFIPDSADDPECLVPDKDVKEEERERTFRIRFIPDKNLFQNGSDPALLMEELNSLGQCRITPIINNIPALDSLAAEDCYISWDIVLSTYKNEEEIKDVFIFVEDNCELNIKTIDRGENFENEDEIKKIGEILIERNDLKEDAIEKALKNQKRLGEILIESNCVDKDRVKSALAEQEHIREVSNKRSEKLNTSSIRVASEKLDTLVDLVGELVTVQARLSQHVSSEESSEMLLIAEEVERLIGELRDNTMSIRMLPIGTTFSKFKRLVRDLSAQLGKEVILTTEGGDTELDKTVIEQLNDPLVHIIRNSIDHGIEHPEKRLEKGKLRQGKIMLSASHSGGNVVIKITDDGAGMDTDAVLAKAIEKGIVNAEADLSEKEILSLIFEPGFSTAGKITNVSGRGVGMDVVKKSIESLRGFINIENKQDKGMAITIKLPLTLAIIDGLVVEVDSEYFIIPVSTIEECVELNRLEAERARERNILDFRGSVIPYFSLRRIFGSDQSPPDIERVIIAEANREIIGFGVDNLIGQNQVVIKSLGDLYKNIKGFSGATILGDGTIALILDIAQLFSLKN